MSKNHGFIGQERFKGKRVTQGGREKHVPSNQPAGTGEEQHQAQDSQTAQATGGRMATRPGMRTKKRYYKRKEDVIEHPVHPTSPYAGKTNKAKAAMTDKDTKTGPGTTHTAAGQASTRGGREPSGRHEPLIVK